MKLHGISDNGIHRISKAVQGQSIYDDYEMEFMEGHGDLLDDFLYKSTGHLGTHRTKGLRRRQNDETPRHFRFRYEEDRCNDHAERGSRLWCLS